MTSSDNFNASGDLKSSLHEIDILCAAAKASAAEQPKFATYNKAALLLLLGKFESFVESIADEFVFKLNQLELQPQEISDGIRYHHTVRALQEIDLRQYRHKELDFKNEFRKIGKLWGASVSFTALKVETKFTYGKHGEKELIKLFERIGIPQIFDAIIVTEEIETVSDAAPVVKAIDFRGIFNTVCHFRNNILHEDASPSLNTDEISQYRRYFEQFATKLDSYLAERLPLSIIQCYI